MDVWQLILYAAASLLALRSLVSLMAHHKVRYERHVMAEHQRHRKSKRGRKNADQPATQPEQAGESAA